MARQHQQLDTVLENIGIDDIPKRIKLTETIQGLLDAVTDKALAKSDESWEKRLPDILAAQNARTDAKIAESENRTQDMIRKLREDIKVEMKDLAERSMAASSVHMPNVVNSNASTQGTLLEGAKPWLPRKLEVKGFIPDWSKREETSLTKPELTTWLDELSTKIRPGTTEHIDFAATKKFSNRQLSTRIDLRLKNIDTEDKAWDVKRDLDTVFEGGDCHIRGIKPRTIVEPSPWKKPYIDQGGKILGLLRKKGVQRDSIKPEWGPPFKVYDVRGDRPLTLAEWDRKSGWAIYEGVLKNLVPNVTVEDLMTSLRA